jgi:cobalamin biosynthesis Mg chelatase CobN
MSEPKKPLITRERYRQYKRDQTTKPGTDEKKVAPRVKDTERSAPTTEKNNKQQTVSAGEKSSVPNEKKRSENGNKAKAAKPKAKLFRKADKPAISTKVERLTDKERGRKLDNYLNKTILIVILLIILVFVIAFVL